MARITRISDVFRSMNEAQEEQDVLTYENTLARMFVSPLLVLGAITTFLSRYYVLHEKWETLVLDSVFLLLGAIFCEAYGRKAKNERTKSFVLTGFFSLLLVFMVIRLYYFLGMSVWTFAVILILLSLLRIKRTMLVITSAVLFLLGIYVWTNHVPTRIGELFYSSQVVAFVYLTFIAFTVHKLIYNRFVQSYQQFTRIYSSEAKLMSTLVSVGDGVIAVDVRGMVDFMNPVAENLSGWKQQEAQGKLFENVFFVVNEYSRERQNSVVKEVLETGDTLTPGNHSVLIGRDGTEKTIEITASPIKSKEGQVIGCVVVFRDIGEKKEKQRKNEYLSYHDQLTGVYNRRYFEEEVKRLDTKRNLPISFIYADVNGLKTINDAFGHQVGDQFIFQAADTIRNICRADDIIARTGGDEIIILLPKADNFACDKVIERLLPKIDTVKIHDISLSVSFGCATKFTEEQTVESVLKNAEDAMYQQKLLGNSKKRSDMIKIITQALRRKSTWEFEHARRVGTLCASIGKAYNLPMDEIKELKMAGEMHDIGKIAVDDVILKDTGELTQSDWAQMKDHPDTGYRILSTSAEYFKIAEFVLAHHERIDGTGYPKGLKGDDIHWKARVIGIAEAYDAMTFDRPFRKALTQEKAVAQLRENAGTQFDEDIAMTFVEKVLGDIW
jgi:diguanylate cyclase (GGDEF)-like protein/PAS domain S-box-containing protein